MLPVASLGSIATEVARPETKPYELLSEINGAGPSETHGAVDGDVSPAMAAAIARSARIAIFW